MKCEAKKWKCRKKARVHVRVETRTAEGPVRSWSWLCWSDYLHLENGAREDMRLRVIRAYNAEIFDESGQDMAEYGLLMGFIAVLVIVLIAALGDNLQAYFDVLVQAMNAWG